MQRRMAETLRELIIGGERLNPNAAERRPGLTTPKNRPASTPAAATVAQESKKT